LLLRFLRRVVVVGRGTRNTPPPFLLRACRLNLLRGAGLGAGDAGGGRRERIGVVGSRLLRRARGAGGRQGGAGDVDPGETVAFGADTATEVASDEEVGGVHGGVAVAAEKCGIGGTIERSLVTAKLASLAHRHSNLPLNVNSKNNKKEKMFGLVIRVGEN